MELQQVILNLVRNGVDATSSVVDRSREVLVRSRRSRESDQVLVGVQDSGIEIERQNLDKIFDTFYATKPQGMEWGSRSAARLSRITADSSGRYLAMARV